MTLSEFDEQFSADSTYEWMGKLGYELNMGTTALDFTSTLTHQDLVTSTQVSSSGSLWLN
jgi:hypothetical protein